MKILDCLKKKRWTLIVPVLCLVLALTCACKAKTARDEPDGAGELTVLSDSQQEEKTDEGAPPAEEADRVEEALPEENPPEEAKADYSGEASPEEAAAGSSLNGEKASPEETTADSPSGEEDPPEEAAAGSSLNGEKASPEEAAAGGPAGAEDLPDEHGTYTSKDDVALFLHVYGRLPDNFMTKKAARALGWNGGSLEKYAPGMCIGGDRFGNYEGTLPDGNYHECDINTLGKPKRGAERLIYADDGRIYYTDDHYETFTLLYGEE